MRGESVGEALGILARPINPSGPAAELVDPEIIDRYREQPQPCKVCGEEIRLVYEGRRRVPVNLDGSPHRPVCSGVHVHRKSKRTRADRARLDRNKR